MNYFWATDGLGNNTKTQEGFISSPKLTRDGKKLHFYETLREVKQGDIIFAFAHKHMISIGIAQSGANSAEIPDYRTKKNTVDGWKIDVRFKRISEKHQISPSEYFGELKSDLSDKYSPLDKNGNGCNNAYFTRISENLKNKLVGLIGSEFFVIIDELSSETNKNFSKIQNDLEDWLEKVTLVVTDPPEKKQKPIRKQRPFKGTKISWKDKQIKDDEIGYAGEAAVFKWEQKKVKEFGDEKLLEKVIHASKKYDNLGYDIISVTKDGNEKFIEVKTTTGGKNNPFDISDNEVKYSKDHTAQYSIYRVYGYNPKKFELRYFEINGDVAKKHALKPTQYRCDPTEPVSLSEV